ncbi:unnamed protein product, partial [Effrenium voratum]
EAFQLRFPDETAPAAPLRALRYTSAGGRHADLRPDGWPVSALLKVAFNRKRDGNNAYSNKVVIMDEVHNLVRLQTQYGEQLAKLRTLLSTATGTVLAGFTGTPILNQACEGRQLLDIIKGGAGRGDGGFLSSFPMRPVGLFPASLPRGVPDGILSPNLRRRFVQKVTLTGEPLKRYDAKRAKGLPDRRLRAYCNLCVHFGSLHEGKNGSKARVLANMSACAPKLFAIAADVVEHPEKALVLINRSSGLMALLEHLRAQASEHNFSVATMEELAEFNSPGNLRGERFRGATRHNCPKCGAHQTSRGGPASATPSALVQSVGRAIRMYGHRGLPEEEQTVTTTLWVAGLPRWMQSPLAAWAFRAQRRREPEDMESGARRLVKRLLAAGLRDLAELKERIETCGGGLKNSDGTKAPLTPAKSAAFLEQVGLWEEAKAVRQRAGKIQARKPRAPPVRKARTRTAKPEVKNEAKVKPEDVKIKKELPETRPGRLVATPQASQEGGGDDRPLAALLATKQPKSVGEAQGPLQDNFAWERDPLLRAMQCLYCAESAADAAEQLHLRPWSADEEALKSLACASREFVPALTQLRERAVDRQVLLAAERRKQATQPEEPVQSEGESSALDFSLSGHEDDAEPAFCLPAGWRTESFRRNGREHREFIDPHGRRFKTLGEARKVADAERTRQNMAKLLQQKVAKLDGISSGMATSCGLQERVLDEAHGPKRQKVQ